MVGYDEAHEDIEDCKGLTLSGEDDAGIERIGSTGLPRSIEEIAREVGVSEALNDIL